MELLLFLVSEVFCGQLGLISVLGNWLLWFFVLLYPILHLFLDVCVLSFFGLNCGLNILKFLRLVLDLIELFDDTGLN